MKPTDTRFYKVEYTRTETIVKKKTMIVRAKSEDDARNLFYDEMSGDDLKVEHHAGDIKEIYE